MSDSTPRPFYQALNCAIAGAQLHNLPPTEVARLLRPILYPKGEDDDLLTSQDVAEYYGRAVYTVYRWRKEGKGPAYVRDEYGRIRYRRRSLREHDEKQKITVLK
jgi:hypothetical protein